MNDRNDIKQLPSESISTKIEDQLVTDGKTTVRPIQNELIKKRYANSKLTYPVLLAGFSGPGMIGSICTNYIIEHLQMHQISYVDSEFILPAVIYIGGNLRHPFRIYANDVGNVCVMVCEVPIINLGIYSVLNTVVKWAKNIGVKEIIVLEGVSAGDQDIVLKPNRSAMILYDNAENEDNSFLMPLNTEDKANTKSYKRAFITGISGGLLAACLSNGIACRGLVIPSSGNIPDPEGATILLESVNRLGKESIKINIGPLKKWAANLKEELGEMSSTIQRQQPIEKQQLDLMFLCVFVLFR
jgi:uncharacterized protein